ncbi:MAG: hypothetical protein IPO09_04470 [Anaeromyxobacter sp.]|nr:hypothetical protein [Anaeromyxobacter sp.]MBL0275839.1 hypothetical protein [Anaeromyxobacter sp.]
MPHLAPSPASTPSGKPAAAGALLVVDVTDELVSARGPVAGLQPMQFGRVLDAQGATVARVMILRVLDQGVLASAIAGKERIARGATLLFDAAPASP